MFADDGVFTAGIVERAIPEATAKEGLVFVHIQFNGAGVLRRFFVVFVIGTEFAVGHGSICLFQHGPERFAGGVEGVPVGGILKFFFHGFGAAGLLQIFEAVEHLEVRLQR